MTHSPISLRSFIDPFVLCSWFGFFRSVLIQRAIIQSVETPTLEPSTPITPSPAHVLWLLWRPPGSLLLLATNLLADTVGVPQLLCLVTHRLCLICRSPTGGSSNPDVEHDNWHGRSSDRCSILLGNLTKISHHSQFWQRYRCRCWFSAHSLSLFARRPFTIYAVNLSKVLAVCPAPAFSVFHDTLCALSFL